jgi:hypothetical protein
MVVENGLMIGMKIRLPVSVMPERGRGRIVPGVQDIKMRHIFFATLPRDLYSLDLPHREINIKANLPAKVIIHEGGNKFPDKGDAVFESYRCAVIID